MNHSSLLLSSAEINERSIQIGIKKATNNPKITRLTAFMAGLFIALGGITNTKILTSIDPGIAPFLGAFMFALGLMLVLVAGGELFTGNILLFGAYLDKKITLAQMLKNWTRVYFWNFIGALFFASLVHLGKFDPAITESLHSSIDSKLSLNLIQCLSMGFLCNVLVCLAVWVSFAANDGASKFILMAIPIIAFILLKYEHSVANMFYFSFAIFTDYNLDFVKVLYNMIPVTIGNILGGMFIAAVYQIAYKK